MAAFLYILFKFTYQQEGNTVFIDENPIFIKDNIYQNCFNSTFNKPYILEISQYRQMEISIFFSQILSIFMYIILCKAYVQFKIKFSTKDNIKILEEEDPLWALI